MEENKKEQAYNCLGNTSWFLDAFLLWVEETVKYGDYFPGEDIRKVSREEVEDFVRRTRCNVRVMQATVNAARHYEKLDDGINEQGLIELHKEVWGLYESIEKLIGEVCHDRLDLTVTDHPALKYLSGPALDALGRTGFEMQQDFLETIIPRAEGQ